MERRRIGKYSQGKTNRWKELENTVKEQLIEKEISNKRSSYKEETNSKKKKYWNKQSRKEKV